MFLNLTPHAITLHRPDGTDETLPPSGTVARIDSTPGGIIPVQTAFAGFPCYAPTQWGSPVGLPEPKDGVFLIVSALFADRVGARCDVFYPGTGPKDGCIREPDKLPDGTPNPKKGQVVAVTRLIQA